MVLGSLISATYFSALILSSSIVSADNNDTSVDNVTITVPVACTLSGTGMNTHTATISPDTYESDIGTTTLKAYCNDPEGFAIYAIGFTGDSYTGTNHTKLVGTTNLSNTISTGTATGSNSSDPSNWAMKLQTVSSPTPTYPITLDNGYGNYSAVPDTYTKVAHRDSGTDTGTGAEGSTLTTTYAAYINGTQPADTYVGKVKYTLVHPSTETPAQPQPSTAGCINYFANASTAIGTMGCESASDGNTVTLLASNFSRTGYGFAGWSDAFDYATNPNANFYGPNEDITVPTGTTENGLSLYAIWVKSEGHLQDSSKVSSICAQLTQSGPSITPTLASVSALTDQRDNETYAIAKLADGNCWMIENLRLDNTNRDNSTGALAQGYGTSSTYGNFSGLADAESSNFDATTAANSLYYSDIQQGSASIDIGTTGNPPYRIPRYNNFNNQSNSTNRPQDPTSNEAINSTTGAGMYSYGNYYNWHAAIASLTYNGTSNQSSTGTSLCPLNWSIPYGYSTNSGASSGGFYYLGNQLGAIERTTAGSRKWRKFPNNFILSGIFNGSSVPLLGRGGEYWSTTVQNNNNAYTFYLSNSYLRPGDMSDYKYLGNSIRCLVMPNP